MQKTLEAALFELGEELALLAGTEWNDAWVGMFGDVLLRRLILHFLLCRAALALHKEYGRVQSYQPTCFPPFPKVQSSRPPFIISSISVHLFKCNSSSGCSSTSVVFSTESPVASHGGHTCEATGDSAHGQARILVQIQLWRSYHIRNSHLSHVVQKDLLPDRTAHELCFALHGWQISATKLVVNCDSWHT